MISSIQFLDMLRLIATRMHTTLKAQIPPRASVGGIGPLLDEGTYAKEPWALNRSGCEAESAEAQRLRGVVL